MSGDERAVEVSYARGALKRWLWMRDRRCDIEDALPSGLIPFKGYPNRLSSHTDTRLEKLQGISVYPPDKPTHHISQVQMLSAPSVRHTLIYCFYQPVHPLSRTG